MVKKFILSDLSTGPYCVFFVFAGVPKSLQKVLSRIVARKIFSPSWGGSRGMLPQKILKMEPLRLAKNACPAYS